MQPRSTTPGCLSYDGPPKPLRWKGWFYSGTHFGDESDSVFWELRRVVDDATEHKLQLSRLLKQNRPIWELALTEAGLVFDECIMASRNAVRQCVRLGTLHENSLSNPKLKDEFQCSTSAVVALLALWARQKRDLSQRACSREVLASCLGGTCAAHAHEVCGVTNVPVDARILCDYYDPSVGVCPRLHQLLQKWQATA